MASGRDASRPFASCSLSLLMLALVACKADIPDGVYACDRDQDCPSGFSCRAKEGSSGQYCFARDEASSSGTGGDGAGDGGDGGDGGSKAGRGGGGAGTAGASGNAGGAGDSGSGGSAGSAGEGGTGGRDMPAAVPATRTGFSTLGQRRGAAGYVLYDDGFERGARLCTSDRKLCVTGGFSP